MAIASARLFGKTSDHIERLEDGTRLHRDVLEPFRFLKAAAAREGIDLKVASGFRDYETQLRIWNEKCEGKRDLLDANGNRLDAAKLSPEQTVAAILRWSAIPGASRHHWGTDFDVFDAAAMPADYRVRLVPEEAAPGGVFERLGRWLEAMPSSLGFFRPYREDRGGVSPEWWHLSYAPLATSFLDAFTLERFREVVESSDLRHKAIVLLQLPSLYARYVTNISPPAPLLK